MPSSDNRVVATDWTAKMVSWFIQHGQLPIILLLALLIGGVASFMGLRREGFPSPDVNVAIINTTYRGASPEEIESSIVKPLESAAQSTKGVEEVRSTSYSGFAVIQVTFTAGYDSKTGLADLRNKVQNISLPKDADKPEVVSLDIGGNVSYYTLTGTDLPILRTSAETFKRTIEAVPGVSEVKVLGDIKDSVEISWRATDLAARGLTPLQLQQAIPASNLTMPGGTVETDNRNATVLTQGSLTGIADIENTVIGVTQTQPPRPVRVIDVADVDPVTDSGLVYQRVGYKEKQELGEVAVTSGLGVSVSFKADADAITTDREIRDALAKMERENSLGPVRVVTVYSIGDFTNEQIDEIREGAIGGPIGDGPAANLGWILGGIQLVILSMLLFVSWRAAIISAAAIPLSLLFTFIALKVQGVTLNTLTLFSMILVLGLIVDPAIVVMESIQREMDLGKRGRDAVIAALNTIGSGVFMAVFTSMIVFVPFGVISGIFGEIVRYIPITVLPALLASYFVPLLFLTYLAQRFLRTSATTKDDEEVSNLWHISQWFIKANRYILNRKWLQVFVVLAGIVLPLGITGYLFSSGRITPVQFSSPDDSASMTVSVTYPRNFTKEAKAELVGKVEPILIGTPEIYNFATMSESESSTQLFINLIEKGERERTSQQIIEEMQGKLDGIADPEKLVFYTAKAQEIGMPADDYPVAVNIYGDSLEDLKNAAIKTGEILKQQNKVVRVDDGFSNVSNPQFEIVLDRARVAASGLTSAQVAQTLAGMISSATVTKYEEEKDGAVRSIDVVLKNAATPTSKEQIENLVVGAGAQGIIQVKQIATVQKSEGFTGINRLDGSRFVTVRAKVEDPLKDAAAPQKAVKDYWTSARLAEYGLQSDALQDKGAGNQFIQSFKDMFIALGIAIIMTYFVFVIFFRSFAQPFIILFAIPLSFLGAFPVLAAIGGQFGFLEILGIIVLVSIVENVGIFLIDLANRKRLEGMDVKEAISLASGIRFRAIFLTKVTALGGLLPLIIISPFWRPLAVIVTAGIISSGVLSLFTTPVLYVWIANFNSWFARGPKGRKAAKLANS